MNNLSTHQHGHKQTRIWLHKRKLRRRGAWWNRMWGIDQSCGELGINVPCVDENKTLEAAKRCCETSPLLHHLLISCALFVLVFLSHLLVWFLFCLPRGVSPRGQEFGCAHLWMAPLDDQHSPLLVGRSGGEVLFGKRSRETERL